MNRRKRNILHVALNDIAQPEKVGMSIGKKVVMPKMDTTQ